MYPNNEKRDEIKCAVNVDITIRHIMYIDQTMGSITCISTITNLGKGEQRKTIYTSSFTEVG